MTRRTSQLVVEMIDRVSGSAKRIGRSIRGVNSAVNDSTKGGVTVQERLHAAIARNDAALSRARMGILDSVGAYYALKGAIGGPVQAAREFESSMADVKKVVNFKTPEEYKQFEKDLMDLSTQVPISVNGLAAIAAAAGQAGIAGEDLTKFTEAAAKVGTAFDISADEAGAGMAKLMTGMGMSIDEVVSLSDAMNYLSNSQASSAAEILDVMKRVGATAKQYGYSAKEVAAFSSAMIASGAPAEVAATSFRNMGRALTKGESATKRQRQAFNDLGLDAGKVAKRMQEDAVATTIDVLERISKLPKETQAAVSSNLFGDEARALGPLLTNLDLVKSSMGLVADESKYAGSAFKEFEVRNATFDAKVRRFDNTMEKLKITIGSALLPVLSDLMDKLAPIAESMANMIDAHPQITAGIMSVVGGLVALKGAIGVLRFVGLLGKGGALALMARGLGLVGSAATAMGASVSAGAATADAALAALEAKTAARARRLAALKWGGIGLAATVALTPTTANTDRMTGESESDMLKRSEAGFAALTPAQRQAAVDAEYAAASGGKIPAEAAREKVALLRSEAVDVRATIAELKGDIDNLGNGPMTSVMAAPLRDQLDARKGDLAELETKIRDAEAAAQALGAVSVEPKVRTYSIDAAISRLAVLAKSFRALPYSAQVQAPAPATSQFPLSGKRAKGGPMSAGGAYLVGENGPEVVTPSRGGFVHPNGSGGGGARFGDIHISFAPVIQGGGDFASMMDRVMREFEDRMRMSLTGVMADLPGGM
ncbi:phage tail tape measure protein [Thioclava pacifica]|uniref:Transglycosylase n=1 Tax=Thioclava pacifica DSM 10166 TaxID=1353537 RepID=A0A074JCR4_9RHOB|nr:phage tail tape measure protein [Thioclava pacifica]KEO53398.1 transglycosylase [Thioclava pacifica DSM 10166]